MRFAPLLAGIAGAVVGAVEGFLVGILAYSLELEPGHDASAITAALFVGLICGAPVGAVAGALAGLQVLATIRGTPARRWGAVVGSAVGAAAVGPAVLLLLKRPGFRSSTAGADPGMGILIFLRPEFLVVLGVLLVLCVTPGFVLGGLLGSAADPKAGRALVWIAGVAIGGLTLLCFALSGSGGP